MQAGHTVLLVSQLASDSTAYTIIFHHTSSFMPSSSFSSPGSGGLAHPQVKGGEAGSSMPLQAPEGFGLATTPKYYFSISGIEFTM